MFEERIAKAVEEINALEFDENISSEQRIVEIENISAVSLKNGNKTKKGKKVMLQIAIKNIAY